MGKVGTTAAGRLRIGLSDPECARFSELRNLL